jgi:hypothetical protein
MFSGRSGLNDRTVGKNVGWRSLAERFGLNLLTQECYRVLAGGTPSCLAPFGSDLLFINSEMIIPLDFQIATVTCVTD